MLRSLHMKLVMLMVLLILSLMTVVGAFLINSVVAFYIQDFYSQMSTVFGDQEIVSDLRTAADGETDGAGALKTVLNAYAGQLGVDTATAISTSWTGRGPQCWPAPTVRAAPPACPTPGT